MLAVLEHLVRRLIRFLSAGFDAGVVDAAAAAVKAWGFDLPRWLTEWRTRKSQSR